MCIPPGYWVGPARSLRRGHLTVKSLLDLFIVYLPPHFLHGALPLSDTCLDSVHNGYRGNLFTSHDSLLQSRNSPGSGFPVTRLLKPGTSRYLSVTRLLTVLVLPRIPERGKVELNIEKNVHRRDGGATLERTFWLRLKRDIRRIICNLLPFDTCPWRVASSYVRIGTLRYSERIRTWPTQSR